MVDPTLPHDTVEGGEEVEIVTEETTTPDHQEPSPPETRENVQETRIERQPDGTEKVVEKE